MRGAKGKTWIIRRRGWIFLDTVLAAAAILGAYALQRSFVFGWGTSNPFQPGAFEAALIYPGFVLVCMHVAGLHDPLGDRRRWFALFRVMIAVMGALGLCLFALYFVSLQQIGRTILIRTFVLSVGLLSGVRFVLWKHAGATPRRIGCYMSAESQTKFKGLVAGTNLPIEITTAIVEGTRSAMGEVVDFFVWQQVEEVVVAAGEGERDLWLACLNRGIPVTDMAHFVEREFYKVPCDDIDLAWFLRFDLKWNHPFYHRIKRLMDILISGLGILLAAPFVLLTVFAIMAETGRPLLYSQIRVGYRGRLYRIWKLRTMRTDAESNGAQWAKQGDSRVTKVGRILRITRVDELPQFWNVLKGEMSMIGPRPERPEFVEQLAKTIPMYPQRHWLKPGITGWAQINYPYGASAEDAREKLSYDLYYMKNASLLLDLHIALRTVGAVMKGSR